ncbi:MAG: hypothetical protein RBU24_16020, partial [Kiritimatiellia bacterium]|nr:hypothetical protein [Kiritimatiellia bacterium]
LAPLGDVPMGGFTNAGGGAACAAAPAWWAARGVTDGAAPAGDFAAAVQGQVKWIARQAAAEFDAWLAPAGGAGPAVSDLLASFSLTNNFRAVTLGQLKNAAAPFHDRLAEVGLATNCPWAGRPADSALANVGQVKALFAFDLSRDTDGDGMPDGWEAAHGFNPLVCQTGGVHGPADDPDGDDMPNAEEGAWGTDPWFPDTDGDLLSDAREVLVHMTDPLLPDTDDNGLEDGYQASVALGSSANLTPISVAVFLDAEKGYIPYLLGAVSGSTYEFYYTRVLGKPVVWIAGDMNMPGESGTSLIWWNAYDGPGRRKIGTSCFWFAGLADHWDDDGLGSGYETGILGYSPDLTDSDGDGVDDGDEDFDGDGLSNLQEYLGGPQGRPHPRFADTDGDGVSDGPLVPDGDFPLVPNGEDQVEAGPDAFPLDPSAWRDTDGDGMPDELVPGVASNSEPPLVEDDDDDNDGLPDLWEKLHKLNPRDPSDRDQDPDSDGIMTSEEYILGTYPRDRDTDGDGLSDSVETGVPFLVLWEGADAPPSVFTEFTPLDVTASDTLRAARLVDGRLLVFQPAGGLIRVFTNDWAAAEMDATESWIVARLSDGTVFACRESGDTVVSDTVGLASDAVQISCGVGHFLVRRVGGGVAAFRENASTGAPESANGTFTGAAAASAVPVVSVSAGDLADCFTVFASGSGGLTVGDVSETAGVQAFPWTTQSPGEAFACKNMLFGWLAGQGASAYIRFFFNQQQFNWRRYDYSGEDVVRLFGGGCSDLLAVLESGDTALFDRSSLRWRSGLPAGFSQARHIWWKRDSRLAVNPAGTLVASQKASTPSGSLEYFAAACTTGSGAPRGIALACSRTFPNVRDSDGDGMPDGWELKNGMDPRDPADGAADTDGDGMPDVWENANGLNSRDSGDAESDSDGDGLTNLQEFGRLTNPFDPDS